MEANNPQGHNGFSHNTRKVRLVKYQRAMPMIVELLKKKNVPMSVEEIHYALIWYWDMSVIRKAVRELLADDTLVSKEGKITLKEVVKC